ncbi:MAG: protein translocase subunit SecD [bacterium]|nr:protein translocase subunit SecD [bacterium]
MQQRNSLWLLFVVVVTAAAIYLILPDTPKPDFLKRGGNEELLRECLQDAQDNPTATFNCSQYEPTFEFAEGLDLVGGLRVLLQAELPPSAFTQEELQQTANNVGRRVNSLGLSEATVQVQGESRILVELPGVTDPQQAINTIQQTALLEFVDFGGLGGQNFDGQRILTTEQVRIQQQRGQVASAEATPDPNAPSVQTSADETGIPNPLTGQPFETIITGGVLQAAAAETDGRSWYIRFELNSEGAERFGPFTAQRVNEPMAIVLDGIVLSSPVIRDRLDTGGVIEGGFTQESAQQLALQLRSGALPIPLRVETAESVGATLGQESVQLSVRAGVVGIIVVLTFMLVYYRVPGLAADLALIVFIILNLALFKLLPVTLTLPAITGYLISVGTAVDGNILIFERIKEELRAGSSLDDALIAGFNRAWTSIRDSNFSTILICGVLFLFGQTPGASIVSGFAITLALGLVVNLFTAVFVTRTFLYLLVSILRQPIRERQWLLGVNQGA